MRLNANHFDQIQKLLMWINERNKSIKGPSYLIKKAAGIKGRKSTPQIRLAKQT